MKLKLLYGLAAFILYAVFVRPGAAHAQPAELSASDSVFDPNIALTAQLPSGSIGLPGERITWFITVSNDGVVSGTNVVVSDTLQPELRVDYAHTQRGGFAINDQMVVFTIPVLEPGQTVQMQINTTVVRSPANGIVVNQALLAANSPAGPITRKTTAGRRRAFGLADRIGRFCGGAGRGAGGLVSRAKFRLHCLTSDPQDGSRSGVLRREGAFDSR